MRKLEVDNPNQAFHQVLQDDTWHFDFSFPMLRFDPLLSRTGLLDDLDWELPDRYLLPDLGVLSRSALEDEPADYFRAAWHERGLLGEVLLEFPSNEWDEVLVSPSGGEDRPSVTVVVLVDTRASAGFGRANEYCHHIEFHMEVPKAPNDTVDGFGVVGGVRRASSFPPKVAEELTPYVLKRLSKGRFRLRYFLSKNALHGYDPIEYGEIGFLVLFTNTRQRLVICSARSVLMPVLENPGYWTLAKLVDR